MLLGNRALGSPGETQNRPGLLGNRGGQSDKSQNQGLKIQAGKRCQGPASVSAGGHPLRPQIEPVSVFNPMCSKALLLRSMMGPSALLGLTLSHHPDLALLCLGRLAIPQTYHAL